MTLPCISETTANIHGLTDQPIIQNPVIPLQNWTSSLVFKLDEMKINSEVVILKTSQDISEFLSKKIVHPEFAFESVCGGTERISFDDVLQHNTELHSNYPTDYSQSEIPLSKEYSTTSGIIVMSTKNVVLGGEVAKWIWDKVNYCVFCGKASKGLARHLQQAHKTEIEVQQAMSYPVRSVERRKFWQKLLHRGNFLYNQKVYETGIGQLVVAKRDPSGKPSDPSKFLPCANCHGLFSRKQLYKHKRKCVGRETGAAVKTTSRKEMHQAAGARILPVRTDTLLTQTFCDNILAHLENGKVAMAVRNDPTILEFGKRLYIKGRKGLSHHGQQEIRCRLRELGRFLIKVRTIDHDIQNLSECIHVGKFEVVCDAVKALSGHDSQTGTYKVPSLALRLGQSLTKCAQNLRGKAVREECSYLRKQCDDFLDIAKEDWNLQVSTQARQTIDERKWNNPRKLPLAGDLKLLNTYLISKVAEAEKSLTSSPSPDKWRCLASCTLARIVLFNRRRSGEVQRMTLCVYKNMVKSNANVQGEVYDSLSPVERTLLNSFYHVIIRGKRNRGVPVLFTPDMHKSTELLIRLRGVCGISLNNNYVFARSGDSATTLRARDILQELAKDCGAQKPELITSVGLRKHVATISQLLNLHGHELDLLAKFMGHDIRVHREYYRLPEDTMMVAKLSKVLMLMERGDVQRFYGKSLDEINIDDADEDDTDTDEANKSENHSDEEEENEIYGDDVDKYQNYNADDDIDLSADSQDDSAKIHNGTVLGFFFHFNLECYYCCCIIVVVEWLECSASNTESTGSSLAQGSYCVGTLNKSFPHSCSAP